MNRKATLAVAGALALAALSFGVGAQGRIILAMIEGGAANSTVRSDGTKLVSSTLLKLDSDGTVTSTRDALPALIKGYRTEASSVSSSTNLGIFRAGAIVAGTEYEGGQAWFNSGSAWTPGTSHPTQFRVAVAASGATTTTARFLIDSNGDIIMNAAAVALATSATGGFTYLPTMAGTPSGTPTSRTGSNPIVWDSSNHKLYGYSGGAWRDVSAGTNTGRSIAASTTLLASDRVVRIAFDGVTAITATLPSASSFPTGEPLILIRTDADPSTTAVTVQRGGSDSIYNSSSSAATSFTLTTKGKTKTLISDGSASWYVVAERA